MTKYILSTDELKRYETILLNENMLFELNAIPQIVVNKDRIIIRVNKKFTSLFGYTQDEILGKQTVRLTPSIKKFKEYEKHFKQTKEGIIKSEELEYRKKDGTLFWVKLEGNPINQQDDELFILWSFIDVTKEVLYREELKHLASIDSMTKLYNRRFFMDISENRRTLAQRDHSATSLIMIDIDYFKQINDTYGHKVGDHVIIALANLLKEMSRKSDIISRWGGEEFIMMLPQTDAKGALIIAEKLKNLVEKLSITAQNHPSFSFTISLGIAEVSLKDEIENSINKADKALYKAKDMGRNRVCLYKED